MDIIKYHVCGADYILTNDARAEKNICGICDRRTGVGGAGLVIVSKNPFRIRSFRANGAETSADISMAICAASFFFDMDKIPRIGMISGGGVIEAELLSDRSVCIKTKYADIESASARRADIGDDVEYERVSLLSSRRIVCFTADVYRAMLFGVGEKMSEYRLPSGRADVDIVAMKKDGSADIRSYERGSGYVNSMSGAIAVTSVLRKRGHGDIKLSFDCGKVRVMCSDNGIALSAAACKIMTAKLY